MNPAAWYIVKCLPDLRRREPRNIGVLLNAHGEWYSRYYTQNPLDGTFNWRKIPRHLNLHAEAFRAWIDYFERKSKSGAWDDVMNLVNSRPRRIYVEPGGSILKNIPDPGATLNELYEEIVEAPPTQSATERLHETVDRILDTAQINPLKDCEVEAEFNGVSSTVHFARGYQNGQLHLMDAIAPNQLTQTNARVLEKHVLAVESSGCYNCPDFEGFETEKHQAQALADAGLLAPPARTVPTREEITDTLLNAHIKNWYNRGNVIERWRALADAVLELMANQPTVNETKAQALEEAAEIVETHRQQRRESIGPIDENTMDPLLVQAHDSGYSALLDAQTEIDRAFNERQDS